LGDSWSLGNADAHFTDFAENRDARFVEIPLRRFSSVGGYPRRRAGFGILQVLSNRGKHVFTFTLSLVIANG